LDDLLERWPLLLIVALRNFVIALSHWCIFHRKKAKEVVETWGRKFREAPREQRVPFLYLANDILQNSRRKGLEFVNEFWTVLPPLLRAVVETGDEAVRNAAFRLVWDSLFGRYRTKHKKSEKLM
jgi:regulator of Ty1 transposition protein 103